MGKTVLYGKVGRSMPLTLEKCGLVGGDNEPISVLKTIATRHPTDTFVIIGRNSGDNPREAGLPGNVRNPWMNMDTYVKEELRAAGLKTNFTIEQQQRYAEIVDKYTLPWFEKADAIIMWAGQHGTSNNPLPKIGDRSVLTKPQDSFVHYAGFLLRGINHWRDVDPINREEIWLNADPRNYLKMRDLKWPLRHPVLAQHSYYSSIKHERYGAGLDRWDEFADSKTSPIWDVIGTESDHQVWKSKTNNVYSGLELNGLLPGTPVGKMLTYDDVWEGRREFGLFVNETRAIGVKPELQRRRLVRDWVLPINPAFIHGSWSEDGINALGVDIQPAPWEQYVPKLQSVRCTFTMPGSGSGWATTKLWEAFAVGTVCFMHPAYDSQNHVLNGAPEKLKEWLRVKTPSELAARVTYLSSPLGRDSWIQLVRAQREHFMRATQNPLYVRMIEDRIYGSEA